MEKIIIGELLGTFVLILFGTGTCAANSLRKSYAQNTGWVFITLGWGFAVFAGIIVSSPLSGAHLNPAVSLGFFLQGSMSIVELLAYIGAQLVGAILGAAAVYQLYYHHFYVEDEDYGGVFFTAPAIKDSVRNFFAELVGTATLVLFIMMMAHDKSANSLFVPFMIVAIGIALGSLTGYAINPVRDFGPRIVYSLTKMGKKYSANWSYAWVPIVGPLCGAVVASLIYTLMLNYL
ncbi:MIP/aquaporin family protein [Mycoplasma sp. P36-A1]|uniref:MIP/aquaporin family protein n=1 Tax=Mycoplasma sp. P36-A1 TaxID=3252900 RepID=UPI003C2B80AC